MAIDYVMIGKRIRSFRKAKKWTQAYLAEMADAEPTNISHIERGATKVSLPTLMNIANALEVTLDEIVYGSLVKSVHVSVAMFDCLLADCTPDEIRALYEITATTKAVMRKYG